MRGAAPDEDARAAARFDVLHRRTTPLLVPDAGRPTPPPATPAPTQSPGSSFGAGGGSIVSDADLHLVGPELAKHVGPMARDLVRHVAKGDDYMLHVITKLEPEIDAEDARRAFRNAVKKLR